MVGKGGMKAPPGCNTPGATNVQVGPAANGWESGVRGCDLEKSPPPPRAAGRGTSPRLTCPSGERIGRGREEKEPAGVKKRGETGAGGRGSTNGNSARRGGRCSRRGRDSGGCVRADRGRLRQVRGCGRGGGGGQRLPACMGNEGGALQWMGGDGLWLGGRQAPIAYCASGVLQRGGGQRGAAAVISRGSDHPTSGFLQPRLRD